MKTAKIKLAILGGKGMLGTDLAALAATEQYAVSVYDLPEFDITHESDIEKAVSGNDIIINCAAYTAVDKAETEKEKCHEINTIAPGLLGKIAADADKYVLHVSTDFVFGRRTEQPINEDAAPEPLNFYGASKLEGEKRLASSGCGHSIIRVEWTYGKHGANFISKIIELARNNKLLKIVDDQFGAPTSTEDVSKAILCLIQKKVEGFFHFAADGYASRFEVGKFIVDKLGIKVEIVRCKSSDFPTPALRPGNSRFDCSKIEKLLDFQRPHWKDSLEKFLLNFR